MSASMEQELNEANEHSSPLAAGRPANSDLSSWSSRPFSGAPSTAFTVSTPSGHTTLGQTQAAQTPTTQPLNSGQECLNGYTAPSPLLDDFLAHYEHYSFVTDLLMIGHLPLTITHGEFTATMDHIQMQLAVSVINNYYVAPEFGQGFLPSANASWANEGFTYPNEHHGTYFLRLAGALPFGGTGQLDEEIRPLAFTSRVVFADPHKTPRPLLVQPVPRDFRSSLLRPPVAVWRGIGSELKEGGGGPVAALTLVSLYVQQIADDRKQEDPNHNWHYHSFLSLHQVTVKPPPKQPPPPEARRRGRDRSRSRNGVAGRTGPPDLTPPSSTGPVQVQYLELFILTVCSAPASDVDNCFAGLIPPPAPFNLPCFPIALCGWWFEMASGLDSFTSNGAKIGPSLELLNPSPTARINGLKPGATVSNIIKAVATEGQDRRRILCGFIDRSTDGGDSCVLLTDGKRLVGTPALRAWSPSMVLHLADDNDDIRRLRDRYRIFRRSLGLPLIPSPRAVVIPSPPSGGPPLRTSPGPGLLTYSEVARVATLPDHDVQALVATTVRQQIANYTASIRDRFEALEAHHAHQETKVADLASEHAEFRQDLRNTDSRVDAAQAIIEVHAKSHQDIHSFMASQSQFLADHERRMKSIESHMQTLAKRRSPDSGLSPGGPRSLSEHSDTDV